MRKWAIFFGGFISLNVTGQKTTLSPVPSLFSNGKYIYTDRNLNPISPTQYDSAFRFREGLAIVHLNGKWEVIDQKGKIAFPSLYDYPGRYWEGLAAAIINKKWGFIDKKGKVVIPAAYDAANRFSEGKARVLLNNKWGFINKSGNVIIPMIYESAHGFSDGLAAVKMNGKWGFIDSAGRLVVPFHYDAADYFRDGLANVRLNNKWGFISGQNNFVLAPIFEDAEAFAEGLAAVKKDGKWGHINTSGQWVVKNIYEDAFSPSEGLARVKLNGKWGFISTSGLIVIPPQYNDVNDFDGGIAGANYFENGVLLHFFIDKTGKEYRLKTDLVNKQPCPDFSIITTKDTVTQGSIIVFKIKSNGNLLKPKYGWTVSAGKIISGQGTAMIKSDSRGLANQFITVTVEAFGLKADSVECRGISSVSVYVMGKTEQNTGKKDNSDSPVPFLKKNGKFIYTDRNLKPVITREFDNASLFEDGIAKVRINKKAGFINETGEEVIPVKYDELGDFYAGLCWAELGNTRGLINRQGVFVMTTSYYILSPNVTAFDGLIPVKQPEGSVYKFGYIGLNGNLVIPFNSFGMVNHFSEGLAAVEQNGKWGYIDKTGKTVIPLKYQYASGFMYGVAIVNMNDKLGLIDKKGKILTAPQYSTFGYFSEGLAAVSIKTTDGKKTGYCDLSGRQVIPFEFEEGGKFSGGYAAVRKYGLWGYIDKTGKILIHFSYKFASPFSEGLASVKQLDGKYGYIDRNNKWVIVLNFADADKIIFSGEFYKGLAFLTFSSQEHNSLWGFYIDKSGREFREK